MLSELQKFVSDKQGIYCHPVQFCKNKRLEMIYRPDFQTIAPVDAVHTRTDMATWLDERLPGVVQAHHAPGPRPVRLVRARASQLAPQLRALLLGLERGVPGEDDEEGGD